MAKNTRPMIRVHDVANDIVTDREMTDEEFAQYQADILASQLAEQTKADLAALKQSVLDRLGITEDEAKALLA